MSSDFYETFLATYVVSWFVYLPRRFERSHSIRRIPWSVPHSRTIFRVHFWYSKRATRPKEEILKKIHPKYNWFVGDKIPKTLKFILHKDGFDGNIDLVFFFFMKLNQLSFWNNKHERSFDCALKSWINYWSMDLQIARDVINKGKHCVTIPFVRKNNDARSI